MDEPKHGFGYLHRHGGGCDGDPDLGQMMSIAETEKLRDRIEELEQLLGVGNDDISRLRKALGIPPQACAIVGFLLKRAVATRESLYVLLFGARPDCDMPEIKIIDVQLVRARKALKKHGITVQTAWGIGTWSIASADKAKLRELMAQ